MGKKKIISQKIEKLESADYEISSQQVTVAVQEQSIEVVPVEPFIDRSPFHAPACCFCRDSKTKIYSKHGKIRYIKCCRCGWTFKEMGR